MSDTALWVVLCGLATWAGATLLLSSLAWFRPVPLEKRLAPFAGATFQPRTQRDIVATVSRLATQLGDRIATILGLGAALPRRLERAGLPADEGAFRLRQFAWAAAGLGLALVLTVALAPPPAINLLFLGGLPILAYLVLEQSVQSRITARESAVFAELPVVTEQLAMLLSAGYSLGAAIARLSERGGGHIAAGFERVIERIRHGLAPEAALAEWADTFDIPELHRLVSVLALTTEASDVGGLISQEAESIRAEAQRRLLATVEKRAQQVWIPVTVATLVPGVIFLSIPFLRALELFAGSS